MEEWVSFDSSGSRLVGILTVPDGSNVPMACVVFVHGWSGNRLGPHRMIVKSARALAKHRIVSLRFDLRGRGDSAGDPGAATLDQMIDDTCAAVDFLRDRFTNAPLILWGICSGGNVAIGTATLRPGVRHMVLLSTLPFVPEKKVSEKVARTRHHAFGYLRKFFSVSTWKRLFAGGIDFAGVGRVLFGHYAGNDEHNPKDSSRDIMRAFRDYGGNALFIYGGADQEAVDARAHYETFAAEVGIPTSFVTIDGANHDFYSLEWERQIAEATLDRIGRP